VAEAGPTTSRFVTLSQAAQQLGPEELEFLLVEERLQSWQREDRPRFEELDRFRQELALRGVPQEDLDAVRAISSGAPIPARSWWRWFYDGGVNPQTGEIIRFFPGHHSGAPPLKVIFRPVLQSIDVLAWLRRRPGEETPAVENRPAPSKLSPPAIATEVAAKTPTSRAGRRDAAIKARLDKGERPGANVTWSVFYHNIRTDCGAFIGNPKDEKYERGFSDKHIQRVALRMMEHLEH
jgi:hypothetical protein